jgi:hypothetical protein
MPLPIFNAEVWGKIEAGLNWWMNNTVDRIFDNMADYSDLRLLKRQTENQQTKPKIEPKPFVPSGREGIVVKTTPPTGDNAPTFTPPPTIQAAGVWESLEEMNPLGLPSLWKWLENNATGPVPWLTSKIRNRFKEVSPQEPTAESSFQFGKLLTGNMTLDRFEATEWTHIVDPTELTQNHQESYEAYAAWLAYQAGGVPLPEEYKGDFYDQGALLWPLDQRDFSGGVTLLFGSRFLGDILANWWTGSLNYDAATLRGTTYYEVNVTRLKASWDRDYSENPAEVDSQVGLDGLALSLANLILDHRVATAGDDAEAIPKPHIILENSRGGGGNSNLDKILAVKDFPFKVPVSLLLEASDLEDMSEDEINDKAYEKIESIPQLMLWLTKALDELIGKFPIKMEIAESDLVSLKEEFEEWEGNNKAPNPNLPFYLQNDKLISYRKQNGKIVKTIKIPNLAEGIAEMLGADLISQQNQTLGLELATRSLLETGSTKNLGVQIHALAEAIADYLGFESQDKIIDVDYTYNPVLPTEDAEGSYKRLLRPSSVQTTILEFVGKNGLEKTIATIQEVYGIIKAAHTEGIGKTDGQLKRKLLDYAAELGIFPTPPPTPPGQEPEADDFDRFLERIEWGFIDQPGRDTNDKPYNREYDKRPRIKRLTKENEGQP